MQVYRQSHLKFSFHARWAGKLPAPVEWLFTCLETMFSATVWAPSCPEAQLTMWMVVSEWAECSPDISGAKSVRSSNFLKSYTHQEATLSLPPASNITTDVIGVSRLASKDGWYIQTCSQLVLIHLMSSYKTTSFHFSGQSLKKTTEQNHHIHFWTLRL